MSEITRQEKSNKFLNSINSKVGQILHKRESVTPIDSCEPHVKS